MIQNPRTPRPFQSGAEYSGPLAGLVWSRCQEFQGGLTVAIKFSIHQKMSSGRSPEGPEIRDYVDFDEKLRPANRLSELVATVLRTPISHARDLTILEGRPCRIRVGDPDRNSGYNPITHCKRGSRAQRVEVWP